MMLTTIAAAAATIAGCPLFPASWSTNQRVDALPVAPDSSAIVRSIGLDRSLKADFGSGLWEGGPIGIPYDVVNRRTKRSRVRFGYAGESDRVRYPIPRDVRIEGGPGGDGDRHALLVDRNRCKLFELYELRRQDGLWTAGSGAVWSLRSPRLRPARVVARAMQEYGLIVADNGSDWYVTGAPHPRWDNEQLRQLGRLRGSDFEVVRAPV